MSETQAGWYPDPDGDTTKIRYWDGQNWTSDYKDRTDDTAANVVTTTDPQVNPIGTGSTNTQPSPVYQPVSQAPTYQTYPVTPTTKDRSGLAIAGLIIGIVGLPLNIFLAILGWICAIIGISFGVMSLKSSKKGIAIASLIIGIVGLVLALINSILGAMLMSGLF
ncbi:MAG: DUF2510 domain-containing protein [Coriobacteriales bacterium]|nr:DUF2510 domain-containing protein [Coriobacteriales bacterium]